MSTNISYIAQEVQLKLRPMKRAYTMPKISSSADLYQILLSSWDFDTINLREEAKLIMLNRNNAVLGIATLATGCTHGVIMDPRMIFQYALLTNASNIVIAHNHPSGSIKPSDPDILLTRKIKQAGQVLEIELIDHLIITEENYYSFADENRL